ncbi:hypothetical protein [Actinokineospora fastidiosa]|uniref:hypothetical protein n=1 Tax=Actinokineospora fastidiosa TaxID=1816 RepID=UPI0016711948|nr:hypothetical protein [Actinokineospora fastidiosa]
MLVIDSFDAWLAQVHDDEDEYAYRAVYYAYMGAHSGRRIAGEACGEVLPGGGYRLTAGRDRELVLGNESARKAFVAHLVARYCGDRYPDMAAWEAARHRGLVEDRW